MDLELHEAIENIVNAFGNEIITQRRFIYMLADYYTFRDNPAERHVISVIVNDGYSASLLKQENRSDFITTMNKIVYEVCRNYGFRDELVKDIILKIANSVGIKDNRNMIIPKHSSPEVPIVEGTIDKEYKSTSLFFLKRTTTWRNKVIVVCEASGVYNEQDGTFVISKGSLLNIQAINQGAYIINDGGELKIKYLKKQKMFSEKNILRKKILEQHCKLQQPRFYLVETDIICATPSEAAFMATGVDANGLNCWKDRKGRSLKECMTSNK